MFLKYVFSKTLLVLRYIKIQLYILIQMKKVYLPKSEATKASRIFSDVWIFLANPALSSDVRFSQFLPRWPSPDLQYAWQNFCWVCIHHLLVMKSITKLWFSGTYIKSVKKWFKLVKQQGFSSILPNFLTYFMSFRNFCRTFV